MDTITLILTIVVVGLLGLYLYNRSRPAPRGTYDDPNARSSGSIGGGPRAHDDPNARSGGSIGGGARSYDDAAHKSRGTIGGDEERTTIKQRGTRDQPMEEYIDDDMPRSSVDRRDLDRDIERDGPNQPRRKRNRVDDDDVRSGGSFGGSSTR